MINTQISVFHFERIAEIAEEKKKGFQTRLCMLLVELLKFQRPA